MTTRRKQLVIALCVSALAIGAYSWFEATRGARAFAQVRWNMTVDEVRKIMGRQEDPPDKRRTKTGEFELSWTFERSGRYTVVFNQEGRSTYKEIAPYYCGVTPLQDKYIEEGTD